MEKKYEYWRREKWGKFRWSENELSPLWQQIVEATSYGDGMTEMENDGESQLVKLYILAAIYNACRSLSHWCYILYAATCKRPAVSPGSLKRPIIVPFVSHGVQIGCFLFESVYCTTMCFIQF